MEALSKAGIANLEEFRFFFDAESKVEPWLGKIQLGAEASIQAARLRRAWHAVSLYYKTAEQDRSRVAIEDLDSGRPRKLFGHVTVTRPCPGPPGK